jgi:hypothetical protein
MAAPQHILVDTMGLLLSVVVHPADVQDRDGAFQLLRQARRLNAYLLMADRQERRWRSSSGARGHGGCES